MKFYVSGINRMIQRSRARKILCGATCVGGKITAMSTAYTAWLNSGGGNGGADSTGGNSPTGNESSGNGGGGSNNGVNKYGCIANVGLAGSSCQQTPGGTYATLAACISGTDCEG